MAGILIERMFECSGCGSFDLKSSLQFSSNLDAANFWANIFRLNAAKVLLLLVETGNRIFRLRPLLGVQLSDLLPSRELFLFPTVSCRYMTVQFLEYGVV